MREKLISLRFVISMLEKEAIPYHIGGSLLLCAAGMRTAVNDIDILFDYCDFEKVKVLFSNHIVRIRPKSENYLTKELIEIKIGETEFDLIFDFGIQVGEYLYHYPISSSFSSQILQLDGKKFVFSKVEEWYLIYKLMNKREAKISLISSYFYETGHIDFDYLDSMTMREMPEEILSYLLTLRKDCEK